MTKKIFNGLTVGQLRDALKSLDQNKPVLLSVNDVKPASDVLEVLAGQECIILSDRVREETALRKVRA